MNIDLFIRERDEEALKQEANKLSPIELADLLHQRDLDEQTFVFNLLDPQLAYQTFLYLPVRIQKNLIRSISPSQAAWVLKELEPGERVEFLEELPRASIDHLVTLLPHDERMLTLSLMGYPENTVGRIMTSDYFTVQADWSVEELLKYLLEYGWESETTNEVYLVNEDSKLLGAVHLKKLLFAPRQALVGTLATKDIPVLSVYETIEKGAQKFEETEKNSLPVIDEEGVLLGVVNLDSVLQFSSEAATAEIQKIGGTEALDEPYMTIPFIDLMRKRAGWLTILFIGEMLTTTAMAFFEDEISKAVVLALFLPLIISSGGNAGSQASTLIVRALALGEVKGRDWLKVGWRELKSGIFLGVFLGVIGFLRVTLWSTFSDIYGPHWLLLAVTIFISITGVILMGNLSGAMLPLILRSLGFDPATSSAPFVATFVDVTGVIIYFLISLFILSGTLL